ncbi:MAG: 4Fe-4S dicluster domain-containing protein [Peptococcaceae bacterium]|nr:4Fe-4S dicluster domain-containing protein [Peptococcaceae bacterium]
MVAYGKGLVQDGDFSRVVRKKSGQPIERCYQCQKCAAGCLLSEYFDYAPNQIVRMIQLGLRDRVLQSNTIWLCSGCQTCGARCPNGVDIAAVMDVLKEMAIAAGINGGAPGGVSSFHQMFVDDIRRRGRINEALLLARYSLKTHRIWADLGAGWALFKKGKLPLFSSRVRRRQDLHRLFLELDRQQWGELA